MTRKEYIKLVQGSGAFRSLDEQTRQQILKAKGADFMAYAEIFSAEKNKMLLAKREFITTTVQVVEGFHQDKKIIITVARKKTFFHSVTKLIYPIFINIIFPSHSLPNTVFNGIVIWMILNN